MLVEFQQPLFNDSLLLRALAPNDFEALYAVASDPLIWQQHPNPQQYQREVFSVWFDKALESGATYTVIDQASKQMIGSSRYYDWKAQDSSIAIGYTFLSRDYWGGSTNRQLKSLMINHAFQWVETVWLHVAASNIRSQKAVLKIGGQLHHKGVKQFAGQTLDYHFYKMNRADWLSQ